MFRNISYFILQLLLVVLVNVSSSQGQINQYNFQKLSVNQGLSGGLIRSISQDRYGYIWIATVGGLNRYDGRNVKNFFSKPGDTTSPYSTQPRCMHNDTRGRFWIGSESGLMEYNFNHVNFHRIKALQNQFITEITDFKRDELLITTRKALWKYNILTADTFNYSNSSFEKHRILRNAGINCIYKQGHLIYIGTRRGLIILNTITDEAEYSKIPILQTSEIVSMSHDSNKNIWMIGNQQIRLAKLNPNSNQLTIYNNELPKGLSNQYPLLKKIKVDNLNNIWIISDGDGLLKFNPSINTSERYLHNIMFSSSPSTNSYHVLFKDNQGLLWLGCDLDGINYFNPTQNMFATLLPFPKLEQEAWSRLGRGITIDHHGNIWMGNQDGLSRFNPSANQYTLWRNEPGKKQILYSNMIRSLYCDQQNNIWIGTGNGVNRFNNETSKLEFIDYKFLPASFYNSINEDRSGHIWFCNNDSASLYWFDIKENKYYSLNSHQHLRKYAGYSSTSYVFEDSQQRLWISFTRKGVVMFDKRSQEIIHYKANEKKNDSLIGNLVIDIKEDKEGWIWLSTFNGLSGIHVNKKQFKQYNKKDGLGGNMCSGLAIDQHDRIWIGANGGLSMLDKTRNKITIFNSYDGLTSVGFPEHSAFMNQNEQIIFPTYNGYLLFDANQYSAQEKQFNFYAVGYTIADKERFTIPEPDLDNTIQLQANQNSFSLHLEALNFINPSQTRYSYTLQGFESEWHYTQDPKAVYTNLPGGDYTFLYKASSNKNWNSIVAKKLSIHLAHHYYKTWWFQILMILGLISILFFIYTYRSKQDRRVYSLLEKTQALEKEKAMAMYENLKQQLNPHFLFNSLTSLNSLIEIEPEKASAFLESLSKTYRYILKSRDHETVSLSDEIKFAKTYIELQQTRFEKGLEIEFTIPNEYLNYRIAPVTLQNLIENAIKHNIIDEENPLTIKIYTQDETLIVENNIQKKKFVETSNQQGLAQMQSLY
ncbi:MAG TPA: two-component regulator propeller domain-containing protein [Chitinophagaceae bacterium]|nr:two-component regulator propeller domain-containing protein [Chitinophagaceae bacterium]